MVWRYWDNYDFGVYPSTEAHANPQDLTIVLRFGNFTELNQLVPGDVIRLTRIRRDQCFMGFGFAVKSASDLEVAAMQGRFGLAYVEETEGSGVGLFPPTTTPTDVFQNYLCSVNIDSGEATSRIDVTTAGNIRYDIMASNIERAAAAIQDVWANSSDLVAAEGDIAPQYLDLVYTVEAVGLSNPTDISLVLTGRCPFKSTKYVGSIQVD